MDKKENDRSQVSREGRWLMAAAVALVLSSLGGTAWVFLNKDSHARTKGRQLPPSAQPARPPAIPATQPPAAR